jgi:6-pyruvoyltetrahydropterin/6-carboxytetrahydropterin synthase
MYEVGTAAEFTALHVMPDMSGPEGELHSHDYRLEVVVRRTDLDERGMVVDLDVLNDAVARTVASVRDQDLETIRPPEAHAVTVEVLARWAHEEIGDLIATEGAEELAVRVYENPDAFGGHVGPIDASGTKPTV